MRTTVAVRRPRLVPRPPPHAESNLLGSADLGVTQIIAGLANHRQKSDVLYRWRAPRDGAIKLHIEATPLIACQEPGAEPPEVEVIIWDRPRVGDFAPPMAPDVGLFVPLTLNPAFDHPLGSVATQRHHFPLDPAISTHDIRVPAETNLNVDVMKDAEVIIRVASGTGCADPLLGTAAHTVLMENEVEYVDNVCSGPTCKNPTGASERVFNSRADFRVPVSATPLVMPGSGRVLISGRVEIAAGHTLADAVDVELSHVHCSSVPPGAPTPPSFPTTGKLVDGPATIPFDTTKPIEVMKHLTQGIKDRCTFTQTYLGQLIVETRTGGANNPSVSLSHEMNVQHGDQLILAVVGRTPVDPASVSVVSPRLVYLLETGSASPDDYLQTRAIELEPLSLIHI